VFFHFFSPPPSSLNFALLPKTVPIPPTLSLSAPPTASPSTHPHLQIVSIPSPPPQRKLQISRLNFSMKPALLCDDIRRRVLFENGTQGGFRPLSHSVLASERPASPAKEENQAALCSLWVAPIPPDVSNDKGPVLAIRCRIVSAGAPKRESKQVCIAGSITCAPQSETRASAG